MNQSADRLKTDVYDIDQGTVIYGDGKLPLQAVERDTIVSILTESGFVLFRDFVSNMDSFTALVEKTSKRVSLDPARHFFSRVAQKVDAGTEAVGLHCENGNSPFWPDLAWFYCEQAASKGSQTTVCDGRRVWKALREETRDLFLKKDICYSRSVAEEHWKKYVYHCYQGDLELEEIKLEHLETLSSGMNNITLKEMPDKSLYYACSVAAARTTLFSDQLAFANSILGPSYNYEKPVIMFSDGTSIPEKVLDEIKEVTEQETLNIDWQTGDVVLIDNTRVMHGRRKIEDERRTIYNALSYL